MTKLHSNQLKPEVQYFRRYFLSKLHDFGCITSPFAFEKRVFTLQTLNIKEYSNLKTDDVHLVCGTRDLVLNVLAVKF